MNPALSLEIQLRDHAVTRLAHKAAARVSLIAIIKLCCSTS